MALVDASGIRAGEEDQSLALSKHCMLAADQVEPGTTFTGLDNKTLLQILQYSITTYFICSICSFVHLELTKSTKSRLADVTELFRCVVTPVRQVSSPFAFQPLEQAANITST